ncbi:hypothetical protein HDU81_000519 [Chytriomyces hyalinus]|nr:hypothetical protein HDU81_000519 [Chytriomyces hyalinus]
MHMRLQIIFELDGTVALVDVDEATFNSCAGVTDTTAPAKGLTSNGPAASGFSYTFAQTGTYYIVSTNSTDCLGGLKFAVAVTDAAAATTTASVGASNESPSTSTDAVVSSVDVTSNVPAPAATTVSSASTSGLLIPSLSIRPSPIVNGVAATSAVQTPSKSGAVSRILASQFLAVAFIALI